MSVLNLQIWAPKPCHNPATFWTSFHSIQAAWQRASRGHSFCYHTAGAESFASRFTSAVDPNASPGWGSHGGQLRCTLTSCFSWKVQSGVSRRGCSSRLESVKCRILLDHVNAINKLTWNSLPVNLEFWHDSALLESWPEQTGAWQFTPGHEVSEPCRPRVPQLQVQPFPIQVGVTVGASAVPLLRALQSGQGAAKRLIWHHNSHNHLS